jgi:alpha-tubulin suppressor-like RCC1 family protein
VTGNAADVAGGEQTGKGSDGDGELGDGTAGPIRDLPVPVKLPAGISITSIRAGCDHTLALTSTGKVLAWGRNRSGQLGNGDHSMVRTASGRVLAWGSNREGELGDGSSEAKRATPAAVKLPVGVRAIALSAGPMAEYSMAITRKVAT